MARSTKTQAEARRYYDLRRRKEAEKDPLVKAVLDRFPGAEVTDIKNGDEDAEI